MTVDFGSVDHLAQAYFHEDFMLESDVPLDMVAMFRRSEPPQLIENLVSAVESMLQGATEAQMREQWLVRSHASYDPSAHGVTYREWFQQVLAVLREPQ